MHDYFNNVVALRPEGTPNVSSVLVVQVQDVPGLVERLLGFLDIGKDFVTAETIVQVKDLARKYPDIAEVCVASVSNISLEVGPSSHHLPLPPSIHA